MTLVWVSGFDLYMYSKLGKQCFLNTDILSTSCWKRFIIRIMKTFLMAYKAVPAIPAWTGSHSSYLTILTNGPYLVALYMFHYSQTISKIPLETIICNLSQLSLFTAHQFQVTKLWRRKLSLVFQMFMLLMEPDLLYCLEL